MASNFDFLRTHYLQLFEHAAHAESLVYSAPRASCFYARFTLEQAVHWLYLFNASPYILTLVIMIFTCSPNRTLSGAPGSLGSSQ